MSRAPTASRLRSCVVPPLRAWAVGVLLALSACGGDPAAGSETDAAVVDVDLRDVVVPADVADVPTLADALADVSDVPDAVDAADTLDTLDALDIKDASDMAVETPTDSTISCGWPGMTCPGECGEYPCGACEAEQACGWLPMPPMSTPRTNAGGTWGDGKLYVWGGTAYYPGAPSDTSPTGKWWNGYLATGEYWDPKTNTWAMLPQAPLIPRIVPTVEWTSKGLLVYGGRSSFGEIPDMSVPWTTTPAIGAIWNPADGLWHPISDLGAPPHTQWGQSKLSDHNAAYFHGDKLYVMSSSVYTPHLGYVYDVPTDTWKAMPLLPTDHAKMWLADGAWAGDELQVFDGNYLQALAYLPAEDTWVNIDPAPGEVVPIWPGATSIYQGFPQGVATYGRPDVTQDTNTLWIRTALSGVWKSLGRPAWFASLLGSKLRWSDNGYFLFVRSDYDVQPLTSVTLYRLATGAWEQLTTLNAPKSRDSGVLVVHDQTLYLVGGAIGTPGGTISFADGGRIRLPK